MMSQLISAFEYTVNFVRQSVADLPDEQMVAQPPGAPNHGAWTMGHLIFSCQGIATELGVDSWLPEDWESVFGYGSTPTSDLSRYPGKAELLTLLADAADRLGQTLLAADDSILARPLPDETFPTMGHIVLQVVVAHTAYHAGQLAVWRRAIGRQSAAVFI